MFPGERREGSPRFGKLHIPVGLWINSPKKRLAKMSRRWPSAGSVRSTSSDPPSRGSEGVELRPPSKTKPSRHKRLSNLFHRGTGPAAATAGGRWASEKKLAELVEPAAGPGGGGEEEEEAPPGQRQLPGILKVFGGGLSRGANYKSVLATAGSGARQLLGEALERYGVPEGRWGDFVLCDVVGRPGGSPGGGSWAGGGWPVEHVRPLGDGERPLVLLDLWRPKSGWSRRLEIRRRSQVERDSDGQDGGGGGGPTAQALRLQKSRSRAASGGPAPPRERPDPPGLRRSISDMNLSTRRRRERRAVLSVVGGEAAAPPPADEPPGAAPPTPPPQPPEGDGGGPEDPALEQLAGGLVQPPQHRPYFLLLQGYGQQDFAVYALSLPQHVFGRRGGPRGPAPPGGCARPVDTFLDAPDLLPRHCLVRAAAGGAGQQPPPGGPAQPDPAQPPPGAAVTVRPFRGAAVSHNGTPLCGTAPLRPGDLLGLGRHVLLLYKDPRTGGDPAPPRPRWLPPAAAPAGCGGALGCPGCGRTPQERGEALRGFLESPLAELRYRPQDEELLLREIVRGGPERRGGRQEEEEEEEEGEEEEGCGAAALAPAFLLGLCLEHAGKALGPQSVPALLGRVAALVRESVGEKIREIAERQPETQQEGPPPAGGPVVAELRPLLLWLANATELLSLAQSHVLELEQELEIEGPSPELTGDLEVCDEALGVLDEVIMSSFQQCVYHLTKALYWALPALLDTNPFSGGAEPGAGGVPEGLRPPLGLFRALLGLSRRCRLHPELASQTFGYLFFFCNACLVNALLERGSSGAFFQWEWGVRLRSNLDALLEALGELGLGDVAAQFFGTASACADLLSTPRGLLGQASWARLRAEHPALSPAQLHHLLRHYRLAPGRAPPPAWDPPPEERERAAAGDIFESLSEHPPLLLPTRGFFLRRGEPGGAAGEGPPGDEGASPGGVWLGAPGGPVTDEGLLRPLRRLRRLLWEREQGSLPANQRGRDGP